MKCNINDQNFQYTGNRAHKKGINIEFVTKSYFESRKASYVYNHLFICLHL